ncbi:hypothetical protein GIB67_013655, partial [Kingdonia uniflora]
KLHCGHAFAPQRSLSVKRVYNKPHVCNLGGKFIWKPLAKHTHSLFLKMASPCLIIFQKLKTSLSSSPQILLSQQTRTFRSKSALDALIQASNAKTPNLVIYNYPSFSGSFAALFAHLYHLHINQPCLILPYSSVEPLRVHDLKLVDGFEACYLLDFVGPKGFAVEICKSIGRVMAFDHRKSVFSMIPMGKDCPENLTFRIDVEKSSSSAVYEYFSNRVSEVESSDRESASLLIGKEKDRLEMMLKYIEDEDLRRWSLPDVKEFSIGIRDERSKLNCVTNPYMFDQLLELKTTDLITKGTLYTFSRQVAARKVLDKKVFKVRLGKGLYGECLGVRADGNSDLSNEIGKELSVRSAAAGLRPIGAVIYMQRNNLKMCLRSMYSDIDTSEVAKAYGGGGSSFSSSFIIRMDEYNQWVS